MQHLYTAEQINRRIGSAPTQFILDCEERFRAQVEAIVETVAQKNGLQLVMLAGPSSSGKTTTAKLMCEGFARRNRPAQTVSLDDFYIDQAEIPRFEDGAPDYETVHSLDIDAIVDGVNRLMRGESCLLPRFSFLTKKREPELAQITLPSDGVLIVEGLHALNPLINDAIRSDAVTRVYVSVSSRILEQDSVLFTKRDLRFVRRMVRDYQFRDSPVDHTFYLWKGVRRGEDRYLFPFRHLADVSINSIHPYEPCVFKEVALPLLQEIPDGSVYSSGARAIEAKLTKFSAVDVSSVPQTSLLREFLG